MIKKIYLIVLLFCAVLFLYSSNSLVRTFRDQNGNLVDEIIVPGIPVEMRVPGPIANPTRNTVLISGVPIFDWCYGCSATSAAMMAGYYDRGDYPNNYSGPTNSGVMPLDNTSWGDGECPLSATHNGIDGLSTDGHVDHFYVSEGDSLNDDWGTTDPTGTYQDCTADFMGTSQDWWHNKDGWTTFYYATNGSELEDYTVCESFATRKRDGCHGMRLFFESRGYQIETNFNQYILGYNGNTTGFSYNNYKEQIDAGFPVLIHVTGHTMLGIGYESTNSTIYIYNTWDHNVHTMTWGGSYSGRAHIGVTVLNLTPNNTNPNLSVYPSSLDFGDVCIYTPYGQLYMLEGTNLTNNVIISAPNCFKVSTSSTGPFQTTLTLIPDNGDLNYEIWVSFCPTELTTYSGVISNQSGSISRSVSVSGTGVLTGTLQTWTQSLDFGNQLINTTSNSLNYDLEGLFLVDDVTVTAPTGFSLATTQTGSYSSELILEPNDGYIYQTIWVRFTPTLEMDYIGNISSVSYGSNTINIEVSGTGVESLTTLYANPSNLNFGSQVINSISSPMSYTLAGNYLTSDIIISSPTGYSIATSQTGVYSSTLSIAHSGGNVNQIIWVKFNPTLISSYSGDITNISTGAPTTNVSVEGEGIDLPDYPVVNIENIDNSQIRLSWNEIPNSTSYRVYYSDYPNPASLDDWSVIAETNDLNYVVPVVNNVGFYCVTGLRNVIPGADFVLVPEGDFIMGDTWGDLWIAELPTHMVSLSSYYICKHEVTQGEWESLMGYNPATGYGEGNSYPVYLISWYSAIKYCNLRSISEGLDPVYTINNSHDPTNWGDVPTSDNAMWNSVECDWSADGYRLPTEAEWEYAARGANNIPDYFYSGGNNLNDVGWWMNNSTNNAHQIELKLPNGLDIYDMTGNVDEFCWDRYDINYYSYSDTINPSGPIIGDARTNRGGSFGQNEYWNRIAKRGNNAPYSIFRWFGLRLVRRI